jgi:hypothetical protein
MTTRLLDRQVRLLDYLTSSGAIFGEEEDATLDLALRGMDPRLLRLEACFSHEKRMEKIIAVFPKTYRLLGAERAAIVREFVKAYPPTDITRIENARQFYDFLSSRWRCQPPEPPYLEDVAACEFACARVRVNIRPPEEEPTSGRQARRDGIRRHPDMVLLRCAYNIRPIVEDDAEEVAVVKRDTPLAIAIPPDAEHPKIFEVPPPVFDVLGALHDWTDRSELGTAPEVDELICELAQHALIEARR